MVKFERWMMSELICELIGLFSQAISRLCDDQLKEGRRAAKKRWQSAETVALPRWAPAIIS